MLLQFKNNDLLVTALTHRSAINEGISTSKESNERLEYLGDAVLELATTKFLYTKFPQETEGNLTAFRSALVKTTTLAETAQEIGLGEQLMMSKGEEAGGGRKNVGLLANTLEAIIGALYLDQGFKAVESFLEKFLFPKFDYIYQHKLYRDPKSLFQEVVQALGLPTPTYQVIKEEGPDHDKTFTVEVLVGDKTVTTGEGRSKQTAQQDAAQKALKQYE